MVRIICLFVFILFLSGCFSSNNGSEPTKEDCKKEGKILEFKERMNYRTGEFEKVGYCR